MRRARRSGVSLHTRPRRRDLIRNRALVARVYATGPRKKKILSRRPLLIQTLASVPSQRTSRGINQRLAATQMHLPLLFCACSSFFCTPPPSPLFVVFSVSFYSRVPRREILTAVIVVVVVVVNRKIVTHLPSANTRTGTREASDSIFRWNIRAKSLGGSAASVCGQKVLATQNRYQDAHHHRW